MHVIGLCTGVKIVQPFEGNERGTLECREEGRFVSKKEKKVGVRAWAGLPEAKNPPFSFLHFRSFWN
jgi:hypothetical protein